MPIRSGSQPMGAVSSAGVQIHQLGVSAYGEAPGSDAIWRIQRNIE